jgi:signal transduction histidine kinase
MNTVKPNILIVDDTRANLRLLARILTEKGYMVRPVPDGDMALSAAQAEIPDLILLDIKMPRLSGYEVCEKLKADEKTRDIPVIFISALDEVMDKVKAFTIGGVDYITKPFQEEEVFARVQTHLTLRNLQKNLEEKNETLSETLKELQAAQNQLILREKMAALGQLIAGIAHEINTPLGAVQASINNISNALKASLRQLPELLRQLSPERQADFFTLSQSAFSNKETLSSKEARQIKREMKKELEELGVDNPDAVASFLVTMGIYEDIALFMPLLREKNNDFILQTAYNLFMLQNNSQNIMMAVDRASKVVSALKNYARHDSFDRMVRANVTEGIEVVLTLWHNRLKKGIEVIRKYEDVPETLCYPDELNQVWTNLIHNAIQAMDGAGRLEIHIAEQGNDIVVRISDSGPGIPEDIQDRIFEPFFTTKTSGEGSGLGLDIARNIISRHKGRIEAESGPGKTIFSVFLPIRQLSV